MTSTPADRPSLLITSGDPAGIGPRAVVLALGRKDVRACCAPILVGERSVWKRAGWTPALAPLMEAGLGVAAPPYGIPTALTGRLSFAALTTALRAVARGLAGGLVTAPISKKAWDDAGVPFRDHTEWLRKETGADGQMILGAPTRGLWASLVTRHVPLAEVSRRLAPDAVLDAARALDAALRLLGRRRPRLGLCGFNPHAGEDGLLGPEERRVLAGTAQQARAKGLALSGPIAADTAWRLHVEGGLDGLVALYHDQALIPLKTAAGLAIVNWTVGLPFARTSPGHGTGFDLAGKGEPDPTATSEAILLAARLAR
jgi:4-hydroxythreonine-4-phosphate dehydrogenase